MFSQIDTVGKREGLEVRRAVEDANVVAGMLIDFGFSVALEKHCGFWLVHWKFPRLRLVSPG